MSTTLSSLFSIMSYFFFSCSAVAYDAGNDASVEAVVASESSSTTIAVATAGGLGVVPGGRTPAPARGGGTGMLAGFFYVLEVSRTSTFSSPSPSPSSITASTI